MRPGLRFVLATGWLCFCFSVEMHQAIAWKKDGFLDRTKAFDARLDVASAVSCVRGSDSDIPARDVPCLCVILTAVGMLTLALAHKLECRLCPIRCKLFFTLQQICLGNDNFLLYTVAPDFVFLLPPW